MADINRNDVAGLIQDAYSDTFLNAAGDNSKVLQAFPTVSMGTKTTNMPVLATVPHAKWIGETPGGDGVKPTAKATWENKQMVAEEVAVIIPVHENTLDDATEDVLSNIATLGGKAMAYALDAAVTFGVNKPASWTSPDLFKAATDGGNLVQVSATPGENDLVGSIFQAAELLDAEGYDPSTFLSRKGLTYRLANLRAADGTPIYLPSLSGTPGAVDRVSGMDAYWLNGTVLGDVNVWDSTKAEAIVVDRERVRIGVRQDITVKFLDQATVGDINLAENDMVALRFKARYAYVLGQTVAENSTASVTKTPVSAVTPAASGE